MSGKMRPALLNQVLEEMNIMEQQPHPVFGKAKRDCIRMLVQEKLKQHDSYGLARQKIKLLTALNTKINEREGNKMNKTELIKAMAETSEVNQQKCGLALDTFMDIVGEQLAAGEKVSLTGFGIFEAKQRAARTGRNPKTGETIQIPATVQPAFKAGKGLKDIVKGS